MQDSPLYSANSLRLCAFIDNQQMTLMFNPTNPTDIDAFEPPPGAPAYRHFNNYNATATLDADGNPDVNEPDFEAFNYEHKVIDIYVKEGWSYVVWNFYNNYTINDFRV